MTWPGWDGTRKVVPAMATRATKPITFVLPSDWHELTLHWEWVQFTCYLLIVLIYTIWMCDFINSHKYNLQQIKLTHWYTSFHIICKNKKTCKEFICLFIKHGFNGFTHDYSISIALAIKIPQSCTKPSKSPLFISVIVVFHPWHIDELIVLIYQSFYIFSIFFLFF